MDVHARDISYLERLAEVVQYEPDDAFTPYRLGLSKAIGIEPDGRSNRAIGFIGNVVECYDFALYGYPAGVIAPVFFPDSNGRAARSRHDDFTDEPRHVGRLALDKTAALSDRVARCIARDLEAYRPSEVAARSTHCRAIATL